jgi:hypothetical protein
MLEHDRQSRDSIFEKPTKFYLSSTGMIVNERAARKRVVVAATDRNKDYVCPEVDHSLFDRLIHSISFRAVIEKEKNNEKKYWYFDSFVLLAAAAPGNERISRKEESDPIEG